MFRRCPLLSDFPKIYMSDPTFWFIKNYSWFIKNYSSACFGSTYSKLVYIRAPPKTGSLIFCHKKRFAVTLFVLCSVRRVVYTSFETTGSENDATIFCTTSLKAKLENGMLLHRYTFKIPTSRYLPRFSIIVIIAEVFFTAVCFQ